MNELFKKRIDEQFDYMLEVVHSDRTHERKMELLESAFGVLNNIIASMPVGLQPFDVLHFACWYASRLALFMHEKNTPPPPEPPLDRCQREGKPTVPLCPITDTACTSSAMCENQKRCIALWQRAEWDGIEARRKPGVPDK